MQTNLFTLALLLAGLLPVLAQGPTPEVVVDVGGTVTIAAPGFQKSSVIDADKANFEIVPDGIRITGKEVGRTTVVVWDRDGRTHSYLVTVVGAGDLASSRERSLLAALAADPLTRDEPITVTISGDAVMLRGTVATAAAAQRAVALLQPRVARVDNQLQVRSAAGSGPLPTLPSPAAPPTRGTPPLAGLPPLGVKLNDIVEAGSLELTVGEARLISVPTEIKRALIAQETVADVVLLPPREVAVIAKQPGDTTLMLWYIGPDAYLGQQLNAQITVHVVGPPQGATTPGNLPAATEIDRILALLGLQGVQVVTRYDAAAPSVILLGTVPSTLHRQRAEQVIAALFPPQARISNFLEVRRDAALRPELLTAQEQRLEKLLAEELPNASIRVRLRLGPDDDLIRVLLSGEAPIPADRLKAEQVVQFELGHAAVITNNILTQMPPPPAELLGAAGGGETGAPEAPKPPLAEALAAAMQASGVPTDRVYVDVFEQPRRRVVLRGTVRNEDEQAQLLEAVQEVVDQYGEYELVDRGLQVKKARVVTEVMVVELGAADSQQLGLAYGVPIGGTSGSGSGGSTSGTNITSSNGQLIIYGEQAAGGPFKRLDPLAASIRALIGNNRTKVLSQPNITSNDNEEGSVEIVTEVPLPSTTTGAGGTTGTSVEFRPVGIRLLVTPRITWGDPSQVEMTIETEVSAVDFSIAINIGGSIIPGVTNRMAKTVVSVDDGETLVIGGLTTENERKNVSRLPFLSEIPVIGELFKYTDTRKEQTTVVVVMTPRIKW